MQHQLRAGLGLLALLAVLTVLVGARLGVLIDLDHAVGRAAFDATAGQPGRVTFWTTVTTWGQPDVVRLVMGVGALALAVARRRDLAAWLVVLVATEAVAAPAAKLVLTRPRPVWTHPITTVGSTSFPSGHATAAATAAVAAVLVGRELGRTAATRVLGPALALVMAAAIAASRVFLGVHFLTDVVGGLVLGGALATLTFAAATARVSQRTVRPRPR